MQPKRRTSGGSYLWSSALMPLSPVIECGACTLRPWRQTDHAALLRYANNRSIWRNLRDRFPHPYDDAAATAWLALAAAAPTPEGVWAIETAGEAIGGLGLQRLPDIGRCSAEIGFWLGEPFWGRGIASAAVHKVADHALQQPDLWRLVAAVFSWNPASGRVLEKAGFKLEAILRRAGIKDGVVIDQLLYARVRDPNLPYAAAT